MSKIIEAEAGPELRSARALEIDIVSDVICPWCFVGKRQFERALAKIPGDVNVSVRWKPFELNPNMPAEGLDRLDYRTRKFGSLEHSQRLDAQVAAAAAQAGLQMRHDLMKRTPNTFDAHRLIWLAAKEDVQDAMVEALFRAYFAEGRDVGDHAVLADLAVEVGLERRRAEAFLASDEGKEEVSAEELVARRQGVNGVPAFFINGQPAFAGALSAELMLAHMLSALGQR